MDPLNLGASKLPMFQEPAAEDEVRDVLEHDEDWFEHEVKQEAGGGVSGGSLRWCSWLCKDGSWLRLINLFMSN